MLAVGIDPSLTSTGIVALDDEANVVVAEALRPAKGLTAAARLDDLHDQFSRLLDQLISPAPACASALVALEGYGYSANSQRLAELGEWVGLVKWELWRRRVGMFIVAPARLKKWVTGKGTAQKDEMRLAVFKRWRFEHPSNDVVDAYGLARLALAILGVQEDMTSAQAQVVSSIRAEQGNNTRRARRAA